MNMLIAVCDDNVKEHMTIGNICDNYLKKYSIEYELLIFCSGEALLKYCDNKENNRIDVLFLDIELTGINGLELKDRLLTSDNIWRISYFSSHTDMFFETYSIKTIGFVRKPANIADVEKILNIVIKEKRDNIVFQMNDIDGRNIEVSLWDILYLRADGSYTEIYTYSKRKEFYKYALCSKKLGDIENEREKYNIIRVHKSYMVNLANVESITENITFNDIDIKIPIGRKYKETVRIKSFNYGRDRMKIRL